MPEIKNPNQGGGGSQDSRMFLVMIVAMFGVLFGLRWYQSRNTPPEPAPAAQQASAPAPAAPSASAASAPATAVPAVQASAESTTVVENELYKITFSNRGAQVTSWILKKFKDVGGQPLDLVHSAAAKQFGYPLSLYTYDQGLTAQLTQALYQPSITGPQQAPTSVTFEYAAGNLQVKKTFTFGQDYVVTAEATVLRDGSPIRALLAWPSGLGDMQSPNGYTYEQIDYSSNGKDQHDAVKNISGGATLNGPFEFVGVTDQYFAAIFMPENPSDATTATLNHQIAVKTVSAGDVIPADGYLPAANAPTKGYLKLPIIGAAVGNTSGHNAVRLFVGPKSMPVLQSIHTADGKNLSSVLDFGFWGPVSKILYIGIHFTQEHVVSNWGWAIICFTIFLNLILTPLRIQGMRAALKMQKIQPGIDAIKAKFKNPGPTDPKAAEMNAEIMAYQKEQGVNMFGGCIPSLIQLPLLIAFFTTMSRIVELRQSHWGWLHDLSQPDPYHILPILMGLTSFAAQYFTPSPGVDPQQQKMMAFMMPAFSVYMTWTYGAALGLYWNTGNLIMILQQQIMNQTSLGKEMRALQQARLARRNNPGTGSGGKTIQGRR